MDMVANSRWHDERLIQFLERADEHVSHMATRDTITVWEVRDGVNAGENVERPVVKLLTGRAFLIGQSGSGKSNSMSVGAEKLLDAFVREISVIEMGWHGPSKPEALAFLDYQPEIEVLFRRCRPCEHL